MTAELIAAAVRLADIIGQENQALRAMDLARAGTLLAAKQDATVCFVAAQPAATFEADGGETRALAARLRALAAENRILLERAIAVQGRVIGIVARAGRMELARAAPRYGAEGRLAEPPSVAVAVSAQA